jgi:hypothetical protein
VLDQKTQAYNAEIKEQVLNNLFMVDRPKLFAHPGAEADMAVELEWQTSQELHEAIEVEHSAAGLSS